MLREDLRLSLSGIRSDVAVELIDIFGSPASIFKLTKNEILSQIELSSTSLNKILTLPPIEKIERELEFIEKFKIRTFTYGDENYPPNLANCTDPPTVLFAKGDIDFSSDTEKWIAVVGTRKCTPYGIKTTENLIEQIAERYPEAVIVSGLAYGIDGYAHRAALKNNLRTVGVLAHGLDMIYPADHRDLAKQIISGGGALVTEFPSQSIVTKYNFVQRNRIVAALCSATILIESPEKGGSMITADLADGYNREVFAVPGRIDDKSFLGNLRLIRSSKANILTSVEDMEEIMQWQSQKETKDRSYTSFILNEYEQEIYDLFDNSTEITTDKIIESSTLPTSKIMTLLTILECKGLIRSVKGKMYIKKH